MQSEPIAAAKAAPKHLLPSAGVAAIVQHFSGAAGSFGSQPLPPGRSHGHPWLPAGFMPPPQVPGACRNSRLAPTPAYCSSPLYCPTILACLIFSSWMAIGFTFQFKNIVCVLAGKAKFCLAIFGTTASKCTRFWQARA